MRQSRGRLSLVIVAAVVVALAVFRSTWLTTLGRMMSDPDPIANAAIAVVTQEAGVDGTLAAADLYTARRVERLALLVAEPSPAERELLRRGLPLRDRGSMLVQLGVPAERITRIDAGPDGGTTDSSERLAAWLRRSGTAHALIVTSATHVHRFRRALQRAMHHDVHIAVVTSPYEEFHADDWWQRRSTLRAGLVELQKLTLDYLRHPL
jgi:hypothetical protein